MQPNGIRRVDLCPAISLSRYQVMWFRELCLQWLLILCVVGPCLQAADTNVTCKPNATVRFANFSATPESTYGIYYEGYLAQFTVTLEDCTRCVTLPYITGRYPRLFQYNASRWNNESTFNVSPGESNELFEAVRHRITVRDDVPAWFAILERDFYDAFAGPFKVTTCVRFNETAGTNYLFLKEKILVDHREMRVIPWAGVCPIIVRRYAYVPAFFFYYAFFGYGGFAILFETPSLFPNALSDRIQRAWVLACAYCTPLTICFLLFALHVVRKSLHCTDSHVYHYHKALARADILIALLVFSKETQLVAFVAALMCYASPFPFRVYTDVQAFVGSNPLRQLFIGFPIISVVTFTSLVQAALAADRLIALYFPIHYLRISNTRAVQRFTHAAAAITALVVVVDLSTDAEILCIVNPKLDGCEVDSFATVAPPVGKLVRAFVLLASSLTQIACCSCVFVKMLLRFRAPEHHQPNAARKLVPFYLLFGTCGLGLISVTSDVLFYIYEYEDKVCRGYIKGVLLISCSTTSFLGNLLMRYRISFVSACSSGGLFLHLLVSSHCRAAAKRGLADGLAALQRSVSKAFSAATVGKLAAIPFVSRTLSSSTAVVAPAESLALQPRISSVAQELGPVR